MHVANEMIPEGLDERSRTWNNLLEMDMVTALCWNGAEHRGEALLFKCVSMWACFGNSWLLQIYASPFSVPIGPLISPTMWIINTWKYNNAFIYNATAVRMDQRENMHWVHASTPWILVPTTGRSEHVKNKSKSDHVHFQSTCTAYNRWAKVYAPFSRCQAQHVRKPQSCQERLRDISSRFELVYGFNILHIIYLWNLFCNETLKIIDLVTI